MFLFCTLGVRGQAAPHHTRLLNAPIPTHVDREPNAACCVLSAACCAPHRYPAHAEIIAAPLQTIVTRWHLDPFSRGAYSYVPVDSSKKDYDRCAYDRDRDERVCATDLCAVSHQDLQLRSQPNRFG